MMFLYKWNVVWVWLSATENLNSFWDKENALEAGTQIRQHNNIQMASLHDDDAALASPVHRPWTTEPLPFAFIHTLFCI